MARFDATEVKGANTFFDAGDDGIVVDIGGNDGAECNLIMPLKVAMDLLACLEKVRHDAINELTGFAEAYVPDRLVLSDARAIGHDVHLTLVAARAGQIHMRAPSKLARALAGVALAAAKEADLEAGLRAPPTAS